MKKISIKGTGPMPINDVSKSFTFGRPIHSAKIILHGDATMDITVDGISDYLEINAKHSNQYRPTLDSLVDNIQSQYNMANKYCTELYRRSVEIIDSSKKKKELESLVEPVYKRKVFVKLKPTKEESIKRLTIEAECRFANMNGKVSKSKIDSFVNENIESLFKAELANWDELSVFFESVEDYQEKAYIEKNIGMYNIRKKVLESIVNGPEDFVDRELEKTLKGMPLPFDALYSCSYNQKKQLMDVQINLVMGNETDLPVPRLKISKSATKPIFSTEKTLNEYLKEFSDTLYGLPFYVASNIFNISTNINKIRIRVVDRDENFGYLWVEFVRDKLSSFNVSCMNVSQFYALTRFPAVINTTNDDLILKTNISVFDEQISDCIKGGCIEYYVRNKNKMKISMSDAALLLSKIYDKSDLKVVIDNAKANGMDYVMVDEKYGKMLLEISQI